MVSDWLGISASEVWLIPFSTLLILLWAILVVRVTGLRSLSKMSSFDFLVTVALGSVLATVSATSTSIVNGAIAFGSLLALQTTIALIRRSDRFGNVVDNEPMLLMTGTEMDDEALKICRITRSDVIAKLREANVTDMNQVLAVVLETTGDISVLHGQGPLEKALLDGVRSA